MAALIRAAMAAALVFAATLAGAQGAAPPDTPAAPAKHVMLFISDGASWGTWHMASYYEHGALGHQPYDAFSVKLGMTTVPLNTSSVPTGNTTRTVSYDPARAWDTTPLAGQLGGRPHHFAGYEYLRRDATDSAAAATALASGTKTYNGAINHDNLGRALTYATQRAKARGQATGVLTSVPFSHATPAAFGAQSASRNSYGAISEQMLANPALDLIMGAGHPLFDADGRPRSSPDHRYVSAAAWAALQGPASPRTLVQTRADFEALALGQLQPRLPLLGLVQVHDTLQANRNVAVVGANPGLPSGAATIPGVPTLATMTRGALQLLGHQPKGFFMMVEGGAVDWMAHANNTARVIEEQMDFNHAVQAAVDWVHTHSHWGESLIIVLTDHGNGMPMGPGSDRVPFEPIRNHGQGVLPGVRWHHGSHSNENTLLWAHGQGAQQLLQAAQTVDPALVSRLGHNRDGRTLTNADVARVLVPAP